MEAECLVKRLVPDMQRKAGTTAEKGYMADNPKLKQLNLNGHIV
jgi:hypothetical protein